MALTHTPPETSRGRRTDALLVLSWVATRGLVVALLLGTYSWVQGDLDYYAQSLADLGRNGWSATLVEYPVPGVLVLGIPWLLSGMVGAPGRYPDLFIAMVLLVDGGFALALRRAPGRRTAAVVIWVAAVPLLGVVGYARFDMVPGVLLGLSVLALTTRPGLAGAWAGLTTAVKLWPGLVLMVIAARRPRPVLLSVAAVGVVSVVVTVLLGGPGRLTSPLTWQSHRGLQVESVLATPAMVAWGLKHSGYAVVYGRFNAYEVGGPGVDTLRTLSAVLTLLLAIGLVWLWSRAWQVGPDLDAAAIGWCCLATVSAYMVCGKVLSPQYFLWLIPTCAAVAAVSRTLSRPLVLWACLLCGVAGLTQLVFPVTYTALFTHLPSSWLAVTLLATRNVLLVALTGLAWRECLRCTARPAEIAR